MCELKEMNYYEVKILEGKENEFSVTKKKVVARNENFIILDTPFYEQIAVSKTWEGCVYVMENKPYIRHRTRGGALDSGIFYKFVSYKTRRASTIKKDIEEYIEKEFGFLNNVDLSFITDKED